MALPLRPPVLPQLAQSAARRCPRATAGPTSRSGTGSARSRSSTATRSTCSRATASRSRATSPSWGSRRGATCSTARSCCSTSRAARTSTRSASASTPPSRASTCSPSRRRRASSPSTCSRVDDETLLELPQRRAPRPARAAGREARRPHARLRGPRRGAALAAGRRGRDRQAPGRALPPGRARRHGEDQARAHDRRRRARVAARQGGGHARLAHPRRSTTPRASCARSATRSGFTAKQKRELPAFLAPYETGERVQRRAEPLERRARDGARSCCARAGRRGDVRPHQQRAHPPRHEAHALARRQGPARLHAWISSTADAARTSAAPFPTEKLGFLEFRNPDRVLLLWPVHEQVRARKAREGRPRRLPRAACGPPRWAGSRSTTTTSCGSSGTGCTRTTRRTATSCCARRSCRAC